MPDDPNPAPNYRLPSPSDTGALGRLALIGAVVALVAGSFAYAGGWLSPARLTPERIVDGFEEVAGVHDGFRRNHAKGVCVAGFFESNGEGARLSKAAVFHAVRVPVIGRFALAGPQPFLPDSPANVRSMALSFRPEGSEEWRTGMNDIPVFPVNSAAAFYEQLLASKPDPATGKPDPARMQAFLASHPETRRAVAIIKARPFTSGFANASYNSLNAFRFVNADGVSTPVRWSMVATDPLDLAKPAESTQADKTPLFDALAARIAQSPVQWHLVVTLGQIDDSTSDPTIAWPDTRERVDVGILTIDHIEAEAPGNCRDVNFDPLVLPPGIAASDDPLLSARSAAYAESFTRRAGEKKEPSAVQVPHGDKGV